MDISACMRHHLWFVGVNFTEIVVWRQGTQIVYMGYSSSSSLHTVYVHPPRTASGASKRFQCIQKRFDALTDWCHTHFSSPEKMSGEIIRVRETANNKWRWYLVHPIYKIVETLCLYDYTNTWGIFVTFLKASPAWTCPYRPLVALGWLDFFVWLFLRCCEHHCYTSRRVRFDADHCCLIFRTTRVYLSRLWQSSLSVFSLAAFASCCARVSYTVIHCASHSNRMREAHKISCEKSKSFSVCVREEKGKKTSRHSTTQHNEAGALLGREIAVCMIFWWWFHFLAAKCVHVVMRVMLMCRSCINTFVALSSNTKMERSVLVMMCRIYHTNKLLCR